MSKSCQPLLCAFVIAVFSSLSYAVTPDRIAGPLSNGQTVTLQAHVHRLAMPQYDQGPVDPAMHMGRMTLLTIPTASQQSALTRLIGQQQDRTSARYHQWLNPDQIADRFGLSEHDIQRITSWLKSKGFTSITVARMRNWVAFEGTAAQVQSAFGAEIHRYNVEGERHYANATAPAIPAALAGIVVGIRGLTDFRPHPMSVRRARPDYNSTNFGDLIAPGDIATMYDINALYNAGFDGTGELLAVAGQTDIYIEDINDFRTGFGLSSISGCTKSTTTGLITACNTSNFQYVLVGTDPQTTSAGDLSEADLDLEWSGAIAQNAQIIYVNSPTGGGAFDAYFHAIDNNLAPVISLSYGLCERDDQPFVASDETELTLGNSEGITILNSSGDSGVAQCDYGSTSANSFLAVNGLSVNYPASSPEVTSVGGTAIPLANFTSTYWGTTNGPDGGTALSYIPEQGWNDDDEIGQFCVANPTNLFCTQGGSTPRPGWVPINSAATAQSDIGISSTGGGASNCATVSGSAPNFVCQSGFAKPSWQTVTVAGQSGARLTPDVSLPASPNFPGYIFCTELSELGISGSGSSCATGIANSVNNDVSIIGGTSASAPVLAGIVTLLNQYLEGPNAFGLGNINPKLYTLAKVAASGAFHKVNTDNNLVYCSVGTPASQPVALRCPAAGVFGYQASTADATTGYNLVTGLGSIDANALAVAWDASRTPSAVAISASPTQINQGQSVTFTATVSPASAVGSVSFYNNGSTTALGTVYLTTTSNGVVTFPTTALPIGTDNVTANYNGDAVNATSVTAVPATVTVVQPDFTVGTNPGSATVTAGHTTGNITVTITPQNGFNSQVSFSCPSAPTGVTCNFNPATVTPSGSAVSTTLTITTDASIATGTTNVTVSAAGSGLTHTSTVALTVNATDQSFTLAPQNATYQVTQGSQVTATVNLTPVNGFNTAVTYTCTEPATLTESTCTGPVGATPASSPASFLITTTAPTFAQQRPFDRGSRLFYAALLPGLLGIVFTFGSGKRARRGMRMLGLILVLGFSTVWLGSCGGNNSSSHNPGTPKGSYTITINATTGGANPVTGSTTFTLQVQ